MATFDILTAPSKGLANVGNIGEFETGISASNGLATPGLAPTMFSMTGRAQSGMFGAQNPFGQLNQPSTFTSGTILGTGTGMGQPVSLRSFIAAHS